MTLKNAFPHLRNKYSLLLGVYFIISGGLFGIVSFLTGYVFSTKPDQASNTLILWLILSYVVNIIIAASVYQDIKKNQSTNLWAALSALIYAPLGVIYLFTGSINSKNKSFARLTKALLGYVLLTGLSKFFLEDLYVVKNFFISYPSIIDIISSLILSIYFYKVSDNSGVQGWLISIITFFNPLYGALLLFIYLSREDFSDNESEKKSSYSLLSKYALLLFLLIIPSIRFLGIDGSSLSILLLDLSSIDPVEIGLFQLLINVFKHLLTVVIGISILIDSRKFQMDWFRLTLLTLISTPLGLAFFFVDHLIKKNKLAKSIPN